MKKQFQILATTLISIAIVSCSKQAVERPEAPQSANEEISTSSSSSSRTVVDPLTVGLEGWFTFNHNLSDQTKKLKDAVTSLSRTASYTYDRNGISNSALKLDSSYYLTISKVPQQTKTSISVWLQYGNEVPAIAFLRPTVAGPGIGQQSKTFLGQINTPFTNTAFSTDQTKAWHHVVVTYDGSLVRLYIDGSLNATVSEPGSFGHLFSNYVLGIDPTFEHRWTGFVDDLRFYSRTLTPSDVQKLYNL